LYPAPLRISSVRIDSSALNTTFCDAVTDAATNNPKRFTALLGFWLAAATSLLLRRNDTAGLPARSMSAFGPSPHLPHRSVTSEIGG